MKYKKHAVIFAATLIFFLVSDFSIVTAAQKYVPLAPLPGILKDQGISLGNYFESLFRIGIGLAGVFAVLMIVIGGVQYVGGAASPSARSDAKNKITNALFGLLLALGAWLLLYTINPDLLKKVDKNIIPPANVKSYQTYSSGGGAGDENTQNYGDYDINDQEGDGP